MTLTGSLLYPRRRSAASKVRNVVYPERSEARLLQDADPEMLGRVVRWTSIALTSPRFWSLRPEWPDLVQEVLARLVASLNDGRYDAGRDFHAYVSGIARYTALQALERKELWRGGDGLEPEADAAWARVAVTDEAETSQAVRRILDEASEDCRALIRSYYLEEKDYEAIASELAIPIGTVKSRLSRCLDCARRSFRIAVRRRSAAPRLREEEIGTR